MLRDVCLTYLESPAASPERESVSSIQLTVTYKDGKSETSDIVKPEAEPSNEKADSDSSGSGGKTNVVFEVKEVADFPQASGFLDIQEIFVVTKNTDRETSQSGADVPPQQQEISASSKRTLVLSVADEEQTEPLCLAKKCKLKYTT